MEIIEESVKDSTPKENYDFGGCGDNIINKSYPSNETDQTNQTDKAPQINIYSEPDTIKKIVFAKEKYNDSKEMIMFTIVNIVILFICAVLGLSWYVLIACACGIGWNVVRMVKSIKLKKYLEMKYNIKNE